MIIFRGENRERQREQERETEGKPTVCHESLNLSDGHLHDRYARVKFVARIPRIRRTEWSEWSLIGTSARLRRFPA